MATPQDVLDRPTAPAPAAIADTAVQAKLMEAVARLRPIIAERARQTELDRRVSAEVTDQLIAAGLYRAVQPRRFGGHELGLDVLRRLAFELGQGCASTGMIYAMHQIQVACLVDHGAASDWHQALLARVAAEQLLLASATSEEAIGGALRSSGCAVNADGDRFHLLKMAPTISYGAHADGILITARRHADASPSDQVLVCAMQPDYTLQSLNTWDTLGMRGTCSNGFRLEATGHVDQVLPVPF
ncbi:UNVERIFIED_CONTAM: acyl-CoA dehydrogenase family protein, partial [Microbacterium sp. SLM126]